MGAPIPEPIRDPLTTTVLLREVEVCEIVGLSRQHIFRLRRDGKFPQPVDVGPRSIRYRTADIKAWVDQLPPAQGAGRPTP